MTDYNSILQAAFAETRITLPDSGVQLAVMLVDAQYMPDFWGMYFAVGQESVELPTIVLSTASKCARSTFAHELGHALHDWHDRWYRLYTIELIEGVANTITRLHDGNSTVMSDIDVLNVIARYQDEYWDYPMGSDRVHEIRRGENLAFTLWDRIRNDIRYAESAISVEYSKVFGEYWCTESEWDTKVSSMES